MTDVEKATKHLGKALDELRDSECPGSVVTLLENLVNRGPSDFEVDVAPTSEKVYFALGIDRYGGIIHVKAFWDSDERDEHADLIEADYEEVRTFNTRLSKVE